MHVVVREPGQSRGIVIFQKPQRNRVQPLGGNLVVRKGLLRARIVYGRGQLAEVSVEHRRSRHGVGAQEVLPPAQRLVVGHEE